MSFNVVSNSTEGSCVEYSNRLMGKFICRKQLEGRTIFVHAGTKPEDVARIDRSITISALTSGAGDANPIIPWDFEARAQFSCALSFPLCYPIDPSTPTGICKKSCDVFIKSYERADMCSGDLFPIVDNEANPDAPCTDISAGSSLSSSSLLPALATALLAPRSKTRLLMLTTLTAILAMNVLSTELAKISST
ncbi:MAG: hypothetical protein K1000chlam4_00357 [Chlamydiae bacterium]|nr:hypothetical protein [Chlamydiota bacterium]